MRWRHQRNIKWELWYIHTRVWCCLRTSASAVKIKPHLPCFILNCGKSQECGTSGFISRNRGNSHIVPVNRTGSLIFLSFITACKEHSKEGMICFALKWAWNRVVQRGVVAGWREAVAANSGCEEPQIHCPRSLTIGCQCNSLQVAAWKGQGYFGTTGSTTCFNGRVSRQRNKNVYGSAFSTEMMGAIFVGNLTPNLATQIITV